MRSIEEKLKELEEDKSNIKSSINNIKQELIRILEKTDMYYNWEFRKELEQFDYESERLGRVNEKINALKSAVKVMEDEL